VEYSLHSKQRVVNKIQKYQDEREQGQDDKGRGKAIESNGRAAKLGPYRDQRSGRRTKR